jgi:hypothetical protein
MKKTMVLGLGMLLAVATAAKAGEVYVPYASNEVNGGVTYKTKVWLTNTGEVERRVTTRFIEEGTDGTNAQFGAPLTVQGGGTLLLTNVVPAGQSGLLEIEGAPQVVVNARLEAVTTGGVLSSAHIPVISPENVLAAGAVGHIQGLERSGQRGTGTDLGLVNLSAAIAQCSVKAFRSNGTQIQQTAILALPALAAFHFPEVFSILGEGDIGDARFEASCDQQFFVYGTVRSPAKGAIFITPSAALSGDLLGNGPGETPNTGDAVVFNVAGTFLDAKNGNSYMAYTLPLKPGVSYKMVTVEFDMYLNRWQTNLFHGINSLRRVSGDRAKRALYYGIQLRGDNAKTTLDLGHEEFAKTVGPWRERTNYQLKITYDVESERAILRVFQGGRSIYQLAGPALTLDVSDNGGKIQVDFGMTKVADGAYYPPVGWKFSNLKVTAEPY